MPAGLFLKNSACNNFFHHHEGVVTNALRLTERILNASYDRISHIGIILYQVCTYYEVLQGCFRLGWVAVFLVFGAVDNPIDPEIEIISL